MLDLPIGKTEQGKPETTSELRDLWGREPENISQLLMAFLIRGSYPVTNPP